MPQFAANLTMLFTEYPFLERFERAARAGFSAVEYMFPYEENTEEIARLLADLRLTQALFNLPAGHWAAGDRGIALDPARHSEFRDGVTRAIELARRFNCSKLNCLVGKEPPGVPEEETRASVVENLRLAARELGRHNLLLLVEPINTFDIPGFYLTTSGQAVALLDEVGEPNTAVQYDIYHMQRMEGNLVHTMERLRSRLGHVQVADAPDRHEPGTGEINMPYVLNALDRLGYQGYVGLEYRPSGTTETSFGWIEAMGFRRH
jgi:hydroxypyruvate isomerase